MDGTASTKNSQESKSYLTQMPSFLKKNLNQQEIPKGLNEEVKMQEDDADDD